MSFGDPGNARPRPVVNIFFALLTTVINKAKKRFTEKTTAIL
jgi:hypothetical protein